MKALLAVLALAAFAGCADDGPEHSTDGAHDHGTFERCPDGTRLDPADYPSHHDEDFDIRDHCPEPESPASVVLDDVADARMYDAVDLAWDLTPATDAAPRAESTGVELTAPNGTQRIVGLVQGIDAPGQAQTTWTPTRDGTWSLQAFAVFEGARVTSAAQDVVVALPEATGDTVRVVIAQGVEGPQADAITLVAGDAVVWATEDPVFGFTITGDGYDATVPAGGESDPVLFFYADTYTPTIEDNVLGLANDHTIEVKRP